MSHNRSRDLTSKTNTNKYYNSDQNDSNENSIIDPFTEQSNLQSDHNINHSSSSNSILEYPSSTSSNYNYNQNNHSSNNQYGKPYTEFSSSDSNLNLLNSESSSSNFTPPIGTRSSSTNKYNKFNSSNINYQKYQNNPVRNDNLKINKPPAYDRYPIIQDSLNNSSTSLTEEEEKRNSPFANVIYPSTIPQQKSEIPKKNNYDSNYTDFSPFGGYPASSFPLNIDEKEPDDDLHNPDPIRDIIYDKNRFWYDLKNGDSRSYLGILSFLLLIIAAVAVFVILPALTFTGVTDHKYVPETYEILTHYSYPMLSAIRTTLIDPDTPEGALTIDSKNGDKWQLVFSDEFNAEGRTFYDGDDQFFTAPDLHYDATKDLEWYDPDAVTTANGTLVLRMDAFKNHNLFYRSGMVQSWNKMCFTQGRIEISARLPNYGTVSGLWPGLWTMGNLGRPGYLATTEGVWPYSYDSCDAGITPNQSSPDGISYLPGQRLNSCTCQGESHPNRGVGRGAPEIDVIEAEIMTDATKAKENNGVASQSLQIAPMDIWYMPDYNFIEIYNASVTTMNTYAGGPFQQAISGTTTLNQTWYQLNRLENQEHNFQSYGFEYLNGDSDGYLRWFVGKNPTLTAYAQALHPNGNIGWRYLSKEPMSIIMNLGVSNNWAYIDWASLSFPAIFNIDYVRVYQPSNNINVGCDPVEYPTADYIEQHLNIYSNVNLTSFEDGGYTFPKHQLNGC
ncbi:KRE6 [Candida jiufengensis]|uniref:KRE6 n=1 Tax=Candida jiufengensis TaxID=497108 RepID=UPI00222467E4|nr:KRE6 [Candida jiufengensis]KAI5952618.1 KRE6 [Candida jiufengensis]